jgi:hypothetical protein
MKLCWERARFRAIVWTRAYGHVGTRVGAALSEQRLSRLNIQGQLTWPGPGCTGSERTPKMSWHALGKLAS